MINTNKNIVEGIGVSKNLPPPLLYFTQLSVSEIIKIPESKPDMEQLLSITADIKVISLKIANTPHSTSNEGQNLSGKKLVIELLIIQKIKYVANDPTQSVHVVHFEKIVSTFVVIPKKYCNKPVELILKRNQIEVTFYIEDILGRMIDKKTIFKNITFLADVTFKKISTHTPRSCTAK